MSSIPLSVEDQLILSTLVYVNFGPFIGDDDGITLGEAVRRVLNAGYDEKNYRVSKDFQLLEVIARAPRYADLIVTDSIEHFDNGITCQFYAFTIQLPTGELFICYRGTDLTLAGWKEDFNMAFEDVVPAQADALEYLIYVAGKYKGKKIIVSGHSKGGNLAVFASAHAPIYVKKRIVAIYNNDGPGFKEDSPTLRLISSISDRLVTLVPTSSIIGMLMDHTFEYTIVESNSISIFQHDPYSWEFDGPKFKYTDKRTQESMLLDRISSEWLKTMSKDEREHLVDTIFTILGAGGLNDFRGYGKNLLQRKAEVIKLYREMTSSEKAVLKKISHNFARIAGRTIFGLDKNPDVEQKMLEDDYS